MSTKTNSQTGPEMEHTAQPTGEAPEAAFAAGLPGNDIQGILQHLAMQIGESSERQGQTLEEVRSYLSKLSGRGGESVARAPGECSASFTRLEESLKGLARRMNELGVSVDDAPKVKAEEAEPAAEAAACASDDESAAEETADGFAAEIVADRQFAAGVARHDAAAGVVENYDDAQAGSGFEPISEVEFEISGETAFADDGHASYMTDIGATPSEDLYRVYGAVARAYDAIAEAISDDQPQIQPKVQSKVQPKVQPQVQAEAGSELAAMEDPQAWRFEAAAPNFTSTTEDDSVDSWDETSAAALLSVYEELPADDVYYPQSTPVQAATPAAATMAVRMPAGSRRIEAVEPAGAEVAEDLIDHGRAHNQVGDGIAEAASDNDFDAVADGDIEISFVGRTPEFEEVPASYENFQHTTDSARDASGAYRDTGSDAQVETDIAWFEQRFDDLANRIDDVAAAQPANEMFEQLRDRLDDIEAMIAQIPQQGSDRESLEIIDGKIDELHNNLERAVAEIERIEIIEDHIAQLIDELGRSHGNLDSVVSAATEKAFARLAPDFSAGQAQALALSGDPVADKRLDQMMELMQSYIAERRDSEDATAQVLAAIHTAVAELSDRVAAFDNLEADEEYEARAKAEQAALQHATEQKADRAEQLAAAKRAAMAAQAKVAASEHPAGMLDAGHAIEADSFGEAVVASAAPAPEPLQRRSVLGNTVEQPSALDPLRPVASAQRTSMSASLGREDMIAQARRAAQAAAADAAAKAAEPAKASKRKGAAETTARTERAGSQLSRSMLVVGKSNPRPVLVAAIFALVLAGAGMLYSKLNRAPAPQPGIEQSMTTPKAIVPEQKSAPVTTEDDELKKSELELDRGDTARNAMLDIGRDTGFEAGQSQPNMSGVSVLSDVSRFGTSYADESGMPSTNVALSQPQDQAVPVAAGAATAMPLDLPPARVGPLSLRLAAAKGEPQAQFEIGTRFAQGQGVDRDLAQAASWFERAAGKGHAPAQYRLGALYERGKGVAEDVDRARIWYGRAAQQGNVKAMHNLAVLYAGPQNAGPQNGGPDYVIASQWFTKAAERGLADSQFNLGILYDNGLGVARSDIKAYQWYSLAARQGDQEASKQKDVLRLRLQPDAVGTVDRIVENWRAVPLDANANESEAASEAWTRAPSSNGEPAVASASAKATAGQIAKAQLLLSRLGYNVGAIDGQMGPRTRDAIRSFRGKMGAGSGEDVSPELLSMLSMQAS